MKILISCLFLLAANPLLGEEDCSESSVNQKKKEYAAQISKLMKEKDTITKRRARLFADLNKRIMAKQNVDGLSETINKLISDQVNVATKIHKIEFAKNQIDLECKPESKD